MDPLIDRKEWYDKEYRDAYMEASITQGIAWQVKLNRLRRGWSEEELAERAGVSLDFVKDVEDTENDGLYQVIVLAKIAKAFDVVLRVDLTDFPTLAESSKHLSETDLVIAPFETTESNKLK